MQRWVRVGGILLAVVLVAWAIVWLRGILAPFAVAFALAYILNPPANGLERLFARVFRRVPWVAPRTAAVGTLAVVVVSSMAVVLLLVVPTVAHQITDTASKLPGYAERLRTRVEPLVQRLNVRYPDELAEMRERLIETARTHLPEIVAPVSRVVGAAFSSAVSLILTVLNLVVIPVFAIYLLYDMNHIVAGLKELVPFRYREYVYTRAREVDLLLSAFVRGQLTVCLILGSFYAVALTACGVPMGIPVGMLIGFFNLIPFMSAVLGLPLAVLLSWVDDQNWQALLAVTAIFALGQIVEGNVITPRIVGQKLGLHAVVVMLAVLIGGTAFGFTGMILAVPTTAALSVFFADFKRLYLASDFFRRDAPGG
jgi:predicted PurR-regulated permease PerM